jgi:calcium/calmodulin-dependent protein kinase (CaM kinase) II
MTTHDDETHLLDLTQRLLDCIAAGDLKTYAELCDPTLTAFEPESCGDLVTGLPFHRFYFELHTSGEAPRAAVHTSVVSPHVRVMGDVAVVCYVRLVQRAAAGSPPRTVRFEETRVWQRQATGWRNVHFHRSSQGAAAN